MGTGGVLTNVSLVIGAGANFGSSNKLNLAGGTVLASSLIVTSGVGNQVVFNSGTLAAGMVYSNGQNFVVGNGSSAAMFQLVGSGSHYFQNNLIITNNVTDRTGNIIVNGGNGQTIIQNGGVLSPGSGVGVLTNSGTLVWNSGGNYQWAMNNATGNAGLHRWDLVEINGVLSNAATALNQFNINITSLTTNNNGAGAVVNFNPNSNYSFTIATASGGVSNFVAQDFNLVTTSFTNAFDGTWSISLGVGNTNVLLNYTGLASYVWNDSSGSFSNLTGGAGANWLGSSPPPLGATNVVLNFGGQSGDASYTATNNLTGLLAKQIILTNNSTVTDYIVGSGNVSLVGLLPQIQQNVPVRL